MPGRAPCAGYAQQGSSDDPGHKELLTHKTAIDFKSILREWAVEPGRKGRRAHRNDARLGRPAFDAQASAPQKGATATADSKPTHPKCPYALPEDGLYTLTAKGRREPALC